MKRTTKRILIIALFSLLMINALKFNIQADIGSVDWSPYYGWVVNREGISITFDGYKSEEYHIPYGARIYIWHGSNYEKSYSVNDSYFAEYNNRGLSFNNSISGRDFRPLSKNPEQSFLVDEKISLYLYKDENIYDGPDRGYKKIKTLEQGTIVHSDYNDGMWAHINENDLNGWIYFRIINENSEIPNCIVVNENDDIRITNTKEVEIRKNINDEIGTIVSENSKLKYNGCIESCIGKKYYYLSNDQFSGFIQDDGYGLITLEYDNVYANIINTVPLYKDVFAHNEISTIIEPGSEVQIINSSINKEGKQLYYCKYENNFGWTSADSADYIVFNDSLNYEKGTIIEDTDIYKTVNGNQSNGFISKGESVEIICSIYENDSKWNYIRSANKEGWICNNVETALDKSSDENTDFLESELSPKRMPNIIWYFVFGIIITSLSSLIMIKYINTRKSK